MTDIVMVTLNPAVDVATSVERVLDTRKLRCSAARRDPSGGGVNVVRVVQRLGGDCVAVYLAGGPLGHTLGQLLRGSLWRARASRLQRRRVRTSVRETSTGREFRFVLPGPTVTQPEWQSCIDHLDALHVHRAIW